MIDIWNAIKSIFVNDAHNIISQRGKEILAEQQHLREMKQEEPSNDMCECKIPQPQIKVSENGIYAYCTKCIRTLNTNDK
jgi:hypothetical protein